MTKYCGRDSSHQAERRKRKQVGNGLCSFQVQLIGQIITINASRTVGWSAFSHDAVGRQHFTLFSNFIAFLPLARSPSHLFHSKNVQLMIV